MPGTRTAEAPCDAISNFNAEWVTTYLLESNELRCDTRLSAFMPTERTGDTQKNELRAKNLLKEADARLDRAGLEKRDRASIIAPLERLLSGREFREHQDEGLVIFAEPDRCLVMRCPQRFNEQLVVGEQYHVLPLLPLLAEPPEFTVLALSRNAVRVVDACRDDVIVPEREIEGMPTRLTDVAGSVVRQDSLQQHSPQASGAAIFHGQGAGDDDELPELERFCNAVAAAIESALGTDRPIVLAGDVRLASIFRRAASNLCLTDADIEGNHDRTPPQKLAALGWEIVRDELQGQERALVERFDRDVGRERASAAEHLIPDAATNGRIEVLLVDESLASSSAESDAANEQAVTPPAVNARLANLAALATLQNGGGVRAVRHERMPRAAALAALLRY